jgi:GDP-L-fucose synthase
VSYWSGRRVLVTGGSGFLGSHLVERLLEEGAVVRATGRHVGWLAPGVGGVLGRIDFREGDLTDPSFAVLACADMEAVFHLAAAVAGVGYNVTHPGSLFRDNVRLGLSVIDAAASTRVERLLVVSSACVYPRFATVPTPESEGFVDDPEPTNLGYGWAKRTLEVQARCYAEEFPIRIGIARPYNLYGPRDNFDPETSHVVPALIRKVFSGMDPIEVWGDGSQTRSFLYVTDCVDGLMKNLELHPVCDPVNIGTDEEITIGDLVRSIVRISGSSARVVFDTSKPAGQPRRNGDFSKARAELGHVPSVRLEEGLARTIDWYRRSPHRDPALLAPATEPAARQRH